MVPGPDIDAVRVQDRADIVGMDSLDHKIQDPVVLGGLLRSEKCQMRDLPESLHGQRCQVLFPLPHGVKTDSANIIDGRVKSYGIRRVDCPRLKLVRKLRPDRALSCDRLDHLPACQERRHRLQKFPLSVEYSDAHGPHQLVPGESQKIRVHGLYIHCHVRCALRPVHHDDSSHTVRSRDDLFQRAAPPRHVGDFTDRDQPCLLRDRLSDRLVCEASVLFAVQIPKRRPCLLGRHLPGQNIAVMLSDRHHDLIALIKIRKPIAVSHQVQALRRIARKDDLRALLGINEPGRCLARRLIAVCRVDAQRVKTAQGIRVGSLIKILHRVDHTLRSLGRRRVVEISCRIGHQQREVLTNIISYLLCHDLHLF